MSVNSSVPVIIVETLETQVLLPFPFNVDLEDVYAQDEVNS